jgi:two-component system NtrC family response regulator
MNMAKQKLLVIDDEPEIRLQMKWALAQDYDVLLAEDRPTAMRIVRDERPAIVTLDLGLLPRPLSAEEGFLALADILQEDARAKVIVITGRTEIEYAREAVAQGAFDLFSKPIVVDELRIVLNRALRRYELERDHDTQRQFAESASIDGILGTSPQMQAVFASIRKVSATDAPVLVVGESGTGKELVARAISSLGKRKNGPFVAINCGAIPDALLESELFGHEKGAFTGAHVQRRGRIELARGGTLFLDEIAELPLLLQVKLLRFLQEQRIERVGGREQIPVDTRVIAATNVDIKQAMAEGRFREDLYYRVNVVTVRVPPLRERGEDALLLANEFLRRYAERNGKVNGFSRRGEIAIRTYSWPGNVRELENRVRRATIMSEGPRVTPADLELVSPYARYQAGGLREAREALEKDLVARALARNNGNVTHTAVELGVTRPTLHDLMTKLGVQRA